MPQDVGAAVSPQAPEMAVLGREPSVEHLDDVYGVITEMQSPRCLLTAVPCVALDADGSRCVSFARRGYGLFWSVIETRNGVPASSVFHINNLRGNLRLPNTVLDQLS